ncbi:hypothetical protein [Flagellimonas sp. SN16]|uniref:hypothetical protein n=1 Tax=Flagellimonas sp. SN16 TaxID=3415142 RepID=UPI003C511D79
MSDKVKTAEQFFKEYGEVTRKYDLTETIQIPYSHIIELMQGYSKHQMSKELEKEMKKTGDLIQFVAVELRGEKLSDEDIESMIHDYVHPKKETKKE